MQSSIEKNLNENSRENDEMINSGLKKRLLFDGENYYLVRSLNRNDIENFDRSNGIVPKIDSDSAYTVSDVIAQVKMQHRKTNLISMSEDPNIVLTYDKSNLHRFVLVKLSKNEIEDSKKVFSAGEYLLGVMDSQIESQTQNASSIVKQVLDNVDSASSVEEIIKIINGADRQVATSLVESKQQYLSEEEQLAQSKKIAKCKVLNYYGLMKGVTRDENGRLIDISEFTQIMRNGYSSSEWLYSGKIEQEKLIDLPKILVDALALVKQAEFQEKDKEELNKVEKKILNLALSGTKINQDNYQLEYSAHNSLKNDLTIDKAFEITGGQISYRDTNMQMIAMRSVAEMTLNKRKIIELLQERMPDINIGELLDDTYCINQEMVTRQNNKGNQIGRNINLLISDYGYSLNDAVSAQILRNIENLNDEQLINVISKGVDSQEISSLLIKTRENDERIQVSKRKSIDTKYIVEAIVEGYNWRKDGNSLTINEKVLLAQRLLLNVTNANQLYTLYEAINKIQVGKKKFTQSEIFAIMINIAIDKKIGDISWKELLEKDRKDIQNILLDNKKQLQTSVLPISMDLLAGRGKEINKLKKELVDLGIDRDFIDSKDIKNIYEAKQIVEDYDFGKEISQREKAVLIKSVLNRNLLDKDNSVYLSSLIQSMEQIGLDKQEICGMIINLGVNDRCLKEAGYSYTSLLNNVNNVRETIKDYMFNINTTVTEGTITRALSENLSEAEQKKIMLELEELGIDFDFLNQKDIRNIYFAKKIVDDYNFEDRINVDEKAALIKSVLNSTALNKESHTYLAPLIQNLEQAGFDEQKIYGMIINLGVNRTLVKDVGYSYNVLLENSNNSRKLIENYRDNISTTVTRITINRAVSENLNKSEPEKIKSELVEMGLDAKFIGSKDMRNLHLAKKIVEDYNFAKEINNEEKVALIKAVLNNSNLDRDLYCLATLIQNLEQIGLTTQEIYGMIINSGVNGSALEETGYSYNELIKNKNHCIQTLKSYKNRIATKVTKGTIDRALSTNLDENKNKKMITELMSLGLDPEFIESKDTKNLFEAKKILEEYDFERKLTKDEKAVLFQGILSPKILNVESTYYLTTLVQNLEKIGLTTQEIYGAIINLGAYGKVVEKAGYSYSDLLNNNNNVQMLAANKGEIKTKVTESTIDRMVSENLTEDQVKKIRAEVIELGVDAEFIDTRNMKNVYIAKKIVEGYDFNRSLVQEEKAALIKSILDNSKLHNRSHAYLTTLIQNFEQIGLSRQETFGTILNLGIYGTVLEEIGYSYTNLLLNANNSCESIRQYKNKIRTKVSEEAIDIATARNVSEAEENKIRSELVQLGIDDEFVESKDIRNLFEAKRIVDKFDFGRKISGEEKASLIIAMINKSDFNKKRTKFLINLMQTLEPIGLSTQEMYGMLINLGVNGKVIKEAGYNYNNLIRNQNNACQTIAQYKDEIQTQVSEETIQKAVKNATKQKKITGKDIVQTAMELVVEGNGGSEICDKVQADYQKLLDQSLQKEGSGRDVQN